MNGLADPYSMYKIYRIVYSTSHGAITEETDAPALTLKEANVAIAELMKHPIVSMNHIDFFLKPAR